MKCQILCILEFSRKEKYMKQRGKKCYVLHDICKIELQKKVQSMSSNLHQLFQLQFLIVLCGQEEFKRSGLLNVKLRLHIHACNLTSCVDNSSCGTKYSSQSVAVCSSFSFPNIHASFYVEN